MLQAVHATLQTGWTQQVCFGGTKTADPTESPVPKFGPPGEMAPLREHSRRNGKKHSLRSLQRARQ